MLITNVKDEVRRLIDRMPDDATWDDVIEEIYLRQKIDAGWADSEAGRTVDVKEIRSRFGLTK